VLNDVNYCIRSWPRGRFLIAHIDTEIGAGVTGQPGPTEHYATTSLPRGSIVAASPTPRRSAINMYHLRPASHRRRPNKLCQMQSRNIVSIGLAADTSDLVSNSTMEPSTSSLKHKRNVRSDAQKRRRAEMRKGPFVFIL